MLNIELIKKTIETTSMLLYKGNDQIIPLFLKQTDQISGGKSKYLTLYRRKILILSPFQIVPITKQAF